jgi:hypothetical protein
MRAHRGRDSVRYLRDICQSHGRVTRLLTHTLPLIYDPNRLEQPPGKQRAAQVIRVRMCVQYTLNACVPKVG